MLAKLNKFKCLFAGVAILAAFVFLAAPNSARAQSITPGPYVPNNYKSVSTTGGADFTPGSKEDDLVCEIENASKVRCRLDAGNASTTCIKAGANRPGGSCYRRDYYYNPVKSAEIGRDVFEADNGSSGGQTDAQKNADWGFIVFPLTSSRTEASTGNYSDIVLTKDYRKYSADMALGDTISQADEAIKRDGPAGICSVLLNKTEPVECMIGGVNNGNKSKVIGSTVSVAAQKGYKSGVADFRDTKGDDCGANGLDFILCPIKAMMKSAIETLYGWLESILDINTGALRNDTIVEGSQRLLNLANGFYILIFLVIIFANSFSIGLDSYALKKMVPRLVAAIILSQFAFLITGAIIEVGNVLGAGIKAFFITLNPGAPPGGAAQITSGVVSGLAIFILLMMFMVAIVALIVVLGILAIRYATLYVLILVAPLAFAAKVLPNTEKLFKTWWTNLVKLVMMYPIIMAIVAGSAYLGAIMKADSNPAVIQITGALLPFIGFLMVPKAFKWSGGVMAATGGKLSGWAAGKTKGAAKDAWSKEGGYKDKIDKNTRGVIPTSLGPVTSLDKKERIKRMGKAGARIDSETESWTKGLDKADLIKYKDDRKMGGAARKALKKKYDEDLEKEKVAAARGEAPSPSRQKNLKEIHMALVGAPDKSKTNLDGTNSDRAAGDHMGGDLGVLRDIRAAVSKNNNNRSTTPALTPPTTPTRTTPPSSPPAPPAPPPPPTPRPPLPPIPPSGPPHP